MHMLGKNGSPFADIILSITNYQYTNAGVHEEADIAERIWQTLQDSLRAIMCTAQFLKKEWTLGFQHAVWLYNRIQHNHHGNKISSFEFVTGLKPDLTQVRIFGAKCYKFQSKDRRVDKLAKSSEQCLCVGHYVKK
jgi:hypothetical protein